MNIQTTRRENLQKARDVRKLSRFELAKIVGCSEEHIKSLEYGRVNPSVKLMYKICSTLKSTPEDIFSDIVL